MAIEREAHDDVVLLRMARAPVNALDLELLDELIAVLGELAGQAPPLVLTGAGSSFSAGVDLRRITAEPAGYAAEFLTSLTAAFRAVFQYPGPTVAAVNGHAIAGGYVLAAACDHRVAAEPGGRLGLSELRVGVPFPTEAIEIVRFAVGTAAARDLVLGAELVDVRTAQRKGYVDELTQPETLDQTAVRRARVRAERGAEAYLLAKRQLQRPAWENLQRSAATEDALVKQLWSRSDTHGRIQKFMASIAE
ncbi:MAG TPA: enoyl-CoA hydratase/isomerase family protein [Actinophytocola sp.]|uniref:enoyl-CoA hydratase/isomerase family protein n=1 Tax=Actinophytocola sp. TaxID=1872138 RepID=UPI002DBCE666|nr:enoyl-CoA hydratase/isomerase family protein [Actinophytocola sp.]HEU5471442.1 enoyl-CoA hydratase/isomerase family protein [Actinophytocola sp.]